MTIHLKPETRGFAQADFGSLKLHYDEQVLQIHVMAEYAQQGLESMADALHLAMDYFVLSPNPPMRSGLGVGTRGEGRGMRRSALDSDRWGRWRPLVVVGGADGGPGQRRWGGVGGTACMGRQSRTGPMRLYGEVG